MRIQIAHSAVDRFAGELVATALMRSFTSAQVAWGAGAIIADGLETTVWINPPESACADLARTLASGGKAVVLGRLGPRVAATLGLELHGDLDLPSDWADCQRDARRHHDVSPVAIHYDDSHPLAALSPLCARPLCRFDFADEWNNLGFGRITLDRSAWSLQSAVEISDAASIARMVTPQGDRWVYAALQETGRGAALWFNRPVGPIDSLEWRVVESFLGDYRPEDLPCFPYVLETPFGYSGAVCARLDCDEAVATSRPLFDLYQDQGLPLSLAVLTGQTLDRHDLQLMREVIAHGGSVVSHSARHAPNWGGCYEKAFVEALESRAWIEKHLPEAAPVRFAVSPFHQNPPYAVAALANAGYDGFVGGIIANDPEYLLGRAGRVPFASRPMVSLSTQCMLHGDCYRRYGNSIDTYQESFAQHLSANSIFGYLDHPFSTRYQYGWDDEATCLGAHRQLIEHVRQQPGIWWASLSDALEFLRQRDQTQIAVDGGNVSWKNGSTGGGLPPLAIMWKGRQLAA